MKVDKKLSSIFPIVTWLFSGATLGDEIHQIPCYIMLHAKRNAACASECVWVRESVFRIFTLGKHNFTFIAANKPKATKSNVLTTTVKSISSVSDHWQMKEHPLNWASRRFFPVFISIFKWFPHAPGQCHLLMAADSRISSENVPCFSSPFFFFALSFLSNATHYDAHIFSKQEESFNPSAIDRHSEECQTSMLCSHKEK